MNKQDKQKETKTSNKNNKQWKTEQTKQVNTKRNTNRTNRNKQTNRNTMSQLSDCVWRTTLSNYHSIFQLHVCQTSSSLHVSSAEVDFYPQKLFRSLVVSLRRTGPTHSLYLCVNVVFVVRLFVFSLALCLFLHSSLWKFNISASINPSLCFKSQN